MSGYVLSGLWLYSIFTSTTPSWVALFIVCLMLAMLLFFSIRLAVGYIRIRADKNRVQVTYLVFGKTLTFPWSALTMVEEVKIPTFQHKEYRQLNLMFGTQKITLNNQVYSGYDSLKSYATPHKQPGKSKANRR
jgi:hypothetical protein